jgi:antirestriction protein ArdC
MEKDKKQINVYQLVTDRILELLAQNIVPWRMPWTKAGIPMNLLTKRPYRGVNTVLLASCNYEHNLFLTWDQIQTLQGSVLKGEKGHLVVFTKMLEQEVNNGGAITIEKKSFLRYYKVYNIAQCKGIPTELIPKFSDEVESSIEQCENVLLNYKQRPKITHKEQEAYYSPQEDFINMPKKKSFKAVEDYYSVLFHEIIHSTGHSSRLNRKDVMDNPKFGTNMYSFEELTAEMGSCYLMSYTGIGDENQFSNSVSYIDSWMQKLKEDNSIIIKAASAAQKSVDYVLNRLETTEKVEETKLVETE